MSTKNPRTADIEISDPEFPNEIRTVDNAEVLYHLRQVNGSELLLLQTPGSERLPEVKDIDKNNHKTSGDFYTRKYMDTIEPITPLRDDVSIETLSFINGAIIKYHQNVEGDSYLKSLIGYIFEKLNNKP